MNKWKLPQVLIEKSKSDIWEEAVLEWSFNDMIEREEDDLGICDCGHENIKYEYHLQNDFTQELLKVGSTCINKFPDCDLSTWSRAFLELVKRQNKGTLFDNNSRFSFLNNQATFNQLQKNYVLSGWEMKFFQSCLQPWGKAEVMSRKFEDYSSKQQEILKKIIQKILTHYLRNTIISC